LADCILLEGKRVGHRIRCKRISHRLPQVRALAFLKCSARGDELVWRLDWIHRVALTAQGEDIGAARRSERGGAVFEYFYFLSLTHLAALAWLVGGLAVCAAETLAPGVFLVWIGGAAAMVGAFSFFVPIRFRWQLLLFGASTAVLVIVGRRVYRSLESRRRPERGE
jgi:hypothetical protein